MLNECMLMNTREFSAIQFNNNGWLSICFNSNSTVSFIFCLKIHENWEIVIIS